MAFRHDIPYPKEQSMSVIRRLHLKCDFCAEEWPKQYPGPTAPIKLFEGTPEGWMTGIRRKKVLPASVSVDFLDICPECTHRIVKGTLLFDLKRSSKLDRPTLKVIKTRVKHEKAIRAVRG
jgi:hypothetical protein